MTEFTRGGVDDVGHDAGIEKLTKGLPEFFLRLELIHHGVEGGSKLADFICGGYGQGIRVLSIGGFMKRRVKAMECFLESTCDKKKNKKA